MKFQYPILITVGLLLTIFPFISSFLDNTPTDFEKGKEILVIRKVGHEILLNIGDKTSLVLPVKKMNQNEFQLRFENSFSFKPDSIVSIIDHVFQVNEIKRDYIVNVLECSNNQIVYGYAIIASQQDEIVPCTDRDLEENCYYVNISFDITQKSFLSHKPIRIGLSAIGLFFIVLGVSKFDKKSKLENTDEKFLKKSNDILKIGSFLFNPDEHFIFHDNKKTKLTAKESKLLSVFANRQNEVIERLELEERVWGEEGVIVGRSLDIFISKLRKKLEPNPKVNIVNIFGKGYKLEIT